MIIEVGICIDLRDAVAISAESPAQPSDKAALVKIEVTSGQTLIGHIDQLDYEELAAFVLGDRPWGFDCRPLTDYVGWHAIKRQVE